MTELSVGAGMAVQVAAQEAIASGHELIGRELLLIGICSLDKVLQMDVAGLPPQARRALQDERNAVTDVLRSCGLDATRLRRVVRQRLGRGNCDHTGLLVHRDAGCRAVFGRAEALAGPGGGVTCLYLLAALMEQPGGTIGQVLQEFSVRPATVRERALARRDPPGGEGRAQAAAAPQSADGQPRGAEAPAAAGGETPYLNRYGRDLTQAAREGRLGPFVGRRRELLQVVQTLARRSKNNPVLVGEAGVGKTALVEALAVRTAQGKDPRVLGGKRIVELSLGALVAGTQYRGEFEGRLDRVLRETRAHPEVILFIDELHTVIGAGRAEGSMDAANLLKPALARGELRCIGATTIAEYRRYIEADAALERRFEKVIVAEPGPAETLEILKGIRPRWEEHHGVEITDQALATAVSLSVRFDGDHQLPDKAIDLVDKAGARTHVPLLSMGATTGDEGGMSGPASPADGRAVVTGTSIGEVLAEKLGLPLEVVTGYMEGMGQLRLRDLEAYLRSHLVGQETAVEAVCRRLLLAHSGLVRRCGPLAVFFFAGPTGVGKTEMARLLARFLFGTESTMIRLDMSEYQEPHSVARLVGSPPGYVGHESEGQLTGRLRTRPYCVVLLDEVEKAHPSVVDLFLQVFDDGRLTDAKGRTADASHAIFIMTSNLAVSGGLGFKQPERDGQKPILLDELCKSFRVEFVNRIDEVVVFRGLDELDIYQILGPVLTELCSNLQQQYGVALDVTAVARHHLARAGYSPDYGARELRRTVERLLHVPLSALLVSGGLQEHPCWQVQFADGGLSILPFAPDGETW
jgi:ATP-dependent Clp protease ATP-binding subunit ClpC